MSISAKNRVISEETRLKFRDSAISLDIENLLLLLGIKLLKRL